jgi:hypothetical protein
MSVVSETRPTGPKLPAHSSGGCNHALSLGILSHEMTIEHEDVIAVGGGRYRWPLWITLLIVGAVIAGGTIGFSHHHRQSAPTHKTATGKVAPACGQDVNRPPHSGTGPIDGGLIVTLAQIPAIQRPVFEPVSAARRWLPADAPLVVVRVGRDARAYPLAILQWHEVVDDTVGGHPIAVTYCPLCNSALVYSRVVGRRNVDLHASGALLLGSAVLIDPVTGHLWSQISGQPYPNYGRVAAAPLGWLPSDTLGLQAAAASNPGLRVLARPADTGYDYASSPYGHVADGRSLPQLYVGWVDEHLPPKTRLVGVTARGAAAAWRYDELRRDTVRDDTVGGLPVVVVYRAHVTGIGDSPDLRRAPQTGSAAVFAARVRGRVLHFGVAARNTLRDRETGTHWDLYGRAVAGPLTGARLMPLRFIDTYWFAWIAFHPRTAVWPSITTSTCPR